IHIWAWHPGDPDTDPVVRLHDGQSARQIVVSNTAADALDLAPMSRPRSCFIPWSSLCDPTGAIRLTGRAGRDVPGSPCARAHQQAGAAVGHRRLEMLHRTPRPRRTKWASDNRPAVVLITHDDGGGVERRVRQAVDINEASGRRCLVI